jgi:Tol biopolymer transport system component
MKAILIGTMAAMLAAGAQSNEAERQLKAAMNDELVNGDLKAAIKQYGDIATTYKNDRAVAAMALVHMAECYQKMGAGEARNIYEQVVRDYSDQKEAVAIARTRLPGNQKPESESHVVTRQIWTGVQVAYYAANSPDGRLLSFADQITGNLAVHELTSSVDRPLTGKSGWSESDDFAEYSTFSPDGKRVAYAWFSKGRYDLRVVAVEAGGPLPRILYANDDLEWIAPTDWSADGRWIAVNLERKDGSTQIGLINAADGTLRVLTSVEWSPSSRMYFSPDSRYLALSKPDREGSLQRDVYVMAIDGSREIPVVVHPANDLAVGWSPDGKNLLFSSDRKGPTGIYAIAFENGRPMGIPRQLHSDIGQGRTIGITRSGTLMFAMLPGSRDLLTATVDFAAGRAIKPPTPAAHQFVGTNYQPDWSPDGRYLSYASYGQRIRTVLKIHDAQTGDTRELAPALRQFNFARWSPDGRSFVAQGTDMKGRQGVFRIDAKTAEIEALELSTTGGNIGIPQWSPDGSKVYFIRRPDSSGNDAILVERDLSTGSDRELLSHATIYWFSPAPDGKSLVTDAIIPRGKNRAISIISTEGGAPRDLLNPSAGFQAPYWTPNGRLILLRKSGDLWAVQPGGGEPRKIDLGAARILDFRVHPDGRQIAFMTRNDTPQEVWAMENVLVVLAAKK